MIKGWTEAMQLMVEGDKWELYVPAALGYGDRGSPPNIPGGATLVFTIEILKIKGGKVDAIKCVPATGDSCSDKELAYIAKVRGLAGEQVEAQIRRLGDMASKPMAEGLRAWIHQRLKILRAKEEL